jgi:FAD/FMN-containing dehydrogenase
MDLRQRFEQALSADAVIGPDRPEELEAYATDYTEEEPRTPGLVVFPSTVEQVQAAMGVAREAGVSLTPRVSGSNVGGLAIAPEGAVVVDLSRMNRVLEVHEQDMYALIEPGVTWEQLKAHLAEQEVPLRMGYPLSPPDTSIVANCLLDGLGNLSMRYGAMADWIGGLEAVLPDGQVIRTGAPALSDRWFGRGPLPDLTGLFVAWQGRTGIVTKMAFQLWPAPEHRRRLFILLYDRNGAFRAMRDLARYQICDDVGGLSWTTGKMLFDVQRPAERDPGEPEFFLYLDISGASERELELRLEILLDYLQRLEADGFKAEKPLDIQTLVRINPRFEKFAEFPTRLSFLVDHSGGGLSWVGTYGPMSRFEAFADAGFAIMERRGMPPTLVSRPMKGAHFGVMRFITTFDKSNADERRMVREMSAELVEAGLELGFIPYKTPPWVVKRIRDRLNPAFVDVMRRVHGVIDPDNIMAPHCWPLETDPDR